MAPPSLSRVPLADDPPVKFNHASRNGLRVKAPFACRCRMPAKFGGAIGVVQQGRDLRGKVVVVLGTVVQAIHMILQDLGDPPHFGRNRWTARKTLPRSRREERFRNASRPP